MKNYINLYRSVFSFLLLLAFLLLSGLLQAQTVITFTSSGNNAISNQRFCRGADGNVEFWASSDFRTGFTLKDALPTTTADIAYGVHINNAASPQKVDMIKDGIVVYSASINPASNDKIKIDRVGSLVVVYHKISATGVYNQLYTFETDANFVYKLTSIKPTAGSFTSLLPIATASMTNPCNAVTAATETTLNWEHVKMYDADQSSLVPIGETRSYANKLGKVTQEQSRHTPTQTVLTTEHIYDAQGRRVLSTLPAPKTGTQLQYANNFLVNNLGNYYNYQSFDAAATLDNPTPVGNTAGTVGAYYSESNTAEPYIPISQFPYSRVEYALDGTIKRVSGVGENFRMGSGHETKMFYVNSGAELGFIYGGRKSYEVNWSSSTPLSPTPKDINRNIVAIKSVTINPDGTEIITYKSLSGLLLATCASGKGENCTAGQKARHTLYDNRGVSALNEYGTGSVKIHLPGSQKSTLKLYPSKGYYLYNSSNPANPINYLDIKIYDLDKNVLLVPGTHYNLNFSVPNWEYSVAFLGTYASATQSAFLRISFSYTPAYYTIYDKGFIPGYEPPLSIAYNLDYSNWSINYYDNKGFLRMTIPPLGINCGLGDPANYDFKLFNDYKDFYTVSNNIYTYATSFTVDGNGIGTPTGLAAGGTNMGTEMNIRLRAMVKPGIVPDLFDKSKASTGFEAAADLVSIEAPPSVSRPLGGGNYLYWTDTQFNANFKPLTAAALLNGDANTTIHSRETEPGPAGPSELCRNGIWDVGELFTDWGGTCGYNNTVPCTTPPKFLVAFKFEVQVTNSAGNTVTGYLYKTLGSDCHNMLLEMASTDGPSDLETVFTNAQIAGASYVKTNITKVWVKDTETGAFPATNTASNFTSANAKHRFLRYIYLDYHCARERYLASSVPHTMATTYHYNDLGQLVARQDPDRGKIEYLYDAEGKLRFSQDAAQRILYNAPTNISAFSYIDYDNEGRVRETGEYYLDKSATTYFFPENHYLPTSTCVFGDTYNVFCNNNILNASGAASTFPAIQTRDENTFVYDFLPAASSLPSGITAAYRPMLGEGQVVYSFNPNHQTWYRYNHRGEVIASVQAQLGLGAADIGARTFDYEYDFFGRLKRSIFQKGNTTAQFEHVYTYNSAGEQVYVETKLGTAGTRLKHAVNTYNKIGQLARTELGDRLQGLDYVYTIDGKLKSLNHPQLNSYDPGKDGFAGANSTVKPDVFGYTLDYHPADYVRKNTFITYGSDYGTTQERFDSRIKGARWNTSLASFKAAAGAEHMYKYSYDWKQQLNTAEFGAYTPNATTNNDLGNGGYASPVYGSFTASTFNWFKEDSISYDLNGNIEFLRRFGYNTANPSSIYPLDLADYKYPVNSNQLSWVSEPSDIPNINDIKPQNLNNYTYYADGDIKIDVANDVSVEYNGYGLVTAVRNAAGAQPKLSFVYDEMGNRIRKLEYTAGVLSKTTLYLREPNGTIFSVFEAPNAGSFTQKENMLAGGAIGTYFLASGQYLYPMRDHLGNVRASIDRTLSGGNVNVLSYADYYPWGMTMPGRELISSTKYRTGFQGQEYENTAGMYGFGLRFYDQRLGRWFSSDPYDQHWSPYLAMSNNPVSFVDPDGGWDEWWNRNSIAYYVDGFQVDAGEAREYLIGGGQSDINFQGTAASRFQSLMRTSIVYDGYYMSNPRFFGSQITDDSRPIAGYSTRISGEVLDGVSEQMAPDDIYMYIGGAKVKVSSLGGRDFTLTYGSNGNLIASESRFPAALAPMYRESVSDIPISKMTPAQILVAKALDVPLSDQTGQYKLADDFGFYGSMILSSGFAGMVAAEAQAGVLAVRAIQANVASSRALAAMKIKGLIPGLNMVGKEYKLMKHASEWFGLARGTSATPSQMALMDKIVRHIFNNVQIIKQGVWRGGIKDAIFFSNGKHIVVTKSNGEFITILKNAHNSGWFRMASVIWKK